MRMVEGWCVYLTSFRFEPAHFRWCADRKVGCSLTCVPFPNKGTLRSVTSSFLRPLLQVVCVPFTPEAYRRVLSAWGKHWVLCMPVTATPHYPLFSRGHVPSS